MNINEEDMDKTIAFISKQTAELVAATKLNFDLQRRVEELEEVFWSLIQYAECNDPHSPALADAIKYLNSDKEVK